MSRNGFSLAGEDSRVLGDRSPEVTTGRLHGLSDEAGGSILESNFRKGTGCGARPWSLRSASSFWTLDESL